jgi:hypothetical protein
LAEMLNRSGYLLYLFLGGDIMSEQELELEILAEFENSESDKVVMEAEREIDRRKISYKCSEEDIC